MSNPAALEPVENAHMPPCQQPGCGGELVPAHLPRYDLSDLTGFSGMFITNVPGLRCLQCRAEYLDDQLLEMWLEVVASRCMLFLSRHFRRLSRFRGDAIAIILGKNEVLPTLSQSADPLPPLQGHLGLELRPSVD